VVRALLVVAAFASCGRVAPVAPGDLPPDPDAIAADLLADDLTLVAAEDVNGTVWRLDLRRGERTFRAKWKPVGPGGSEVQDGYDGNNSPRCEVAAWRMNRLLFGDRSTDRHLVAPVVVRAFHRDVPCERACARVPRLPGVAGAATFPEVNDHLVLGALTFWIDGVTHLERFEGGLWDRRRFESNASYARSFSDLCLFLYLIGHGDANYADNFLAREPGLDRLYSIDNGRAFDGVPFYTDEGDPDWAPFARLAPGKLVAPWFARETLERVRQLDRAALDRALRVVAAIDLASGRVGEVSRDGMTKRGRGLWRGGDWVVWGIGDEGIAGVERRARELGDLPAR
jgi:hypothetical protein